MVLKKGSSGEEVKQLQKKLGITADGDFGPGTEKKVKEWQPANGLKADGIVGDSTWKKMFGAAPSATKAAPASPSALVATDKPTSPAPSASMPFNLDKLKGHVPDAVLAQIPETAKRFNITTALRLAHFLAQCGHESAGFTAVRENLNYSAAGFKKTFPKYFPGNLAESCARNPEKIGARVYANRMGNGDEASKEGYIFRGRGYIQLTGKDNYRSFDATLDDSILADPDLVATRYPLASAGFFFDQDKLWAVCDKGSDDATVTAVTKRVNGGTIGLADRIKHFKEYHGLLK